jgi:hypothetical protein
MRALKEDAMGTWTLRLGLGLLVMAGACPCCLRAQSTVPAGLYVVPTVPYEPAQVAQPPMPSGLQDSWQTAPAAPLPTADQGKPEMYSVWARSEYMLWWIKAAPLPVPIVTTGTPSTGFPANTAGGIGQAGTQVLLGDGTQDFRGFSGTRLALGAWVDSAGKVGFELSGFVLEHRAASFTDSSDGTGNPPIYLPRFNASAGIEDALPGFAGNVIVTSPFQLWGLEFNGALNLYRDAGAEFNLLAGFRYADLRETLLIHNSSTDLIFGNTVSMNDFFGTRNQFYGAQFGGRFSIGGDRLAVDLAGFLAIGSIHEVVQVEGTTTQLGPNPLTPPGLGTFRGGYFAQPSNIGVFNKNQFGVLPTVEFKIGYLLTDWLRLSVGYDFLYWNQVVRPGNQMDHNINLTQSTVLSPTGVGGLVGPGVPAQQFIRSDFWAHGLTFGMELRF